MSAPPPPLTQQIIHLLATVAGAGLHYICIKKTCYEYEGNGGPQS